LRNQSHVLQSDSSRILDHFDLSLAISLPAAGGITAFIESRQAVDKLGVVSEPLELIDD
jgi:hypothetical protein